MRKLSKLSSMPSSPLPPSPALRNPFTPTFGTSPAVYVGRDDIIDAFSGALIDGPGAPSRAMIITGTRGIGKTVLLNELEDEAKRAGWRVIPETALPGLIDRIVQQQLPSLLSDIDPRSSRRRITGITAPAGLGGIRTEIKDRHTPEPGLRPLLTEAVELLAQQGSGLFLTVDEVGRATADELAELTAAIQHLFRENGNIAIALAGLPEEIATLLEHRGITFLRRADRRILGAVTPAQAEEGLAAPVQAAGLSWDATGLRSAIAATHGYPFMIQLIGYHAWRAQQHLDGGEISSSISVRAATTGVEAATDELGHLVLDPVIASLTELELAYLKAMAVDDGPSRSGDIADRIARGSDVTAQYRRRLIARHIIFSRGHGQVDFAIPGLREYLRREDESGPQLFW